MNHEHVKKLLSGVEQWNTWRVENPDIRPDLAGAHLRFAVLTGANLQVTNFVGTNLKGVDLTESHLAGADLTGADLTDVRMNWSSHELIGTRLRQSAIREEENVDYDRIALAGAILTNAQHCWGYWLEVDIPPSVKTWALDTMATWVREGDHAPQVLSERGIATQ